MKIFKHPEIKESKLAVVTRAKDDYDLSEITHPVIKNYAERCGADFIVINEEKMALGDFSFEIFQCYDLFDSYDRILSIDTDTVITLWCPDLFKLVPNNCIGTIYEDKFSRAKSRRYLIEKVQGKWGDVGWRRGYINTGVFLASKMHRELFACRKERQWLGKEEGFDDIYLGYRINELKYRVYELPYRFNHMSMFSEVGYNWLKSNIIHYAGRGFSRKRRFDQITSDLEALQNVPARTLLNFYRIPERLRLIAIGILTWYRETRSHKYHER